MDWTSIAVAVVTAFGAFLGTYFSNKKQTALMAYRIEEVEKKVDKLETKVDKHNQVVERTIRLEQRVDDLDKKVG